MQPTKLELTVQNLEDRQKLRDAIAMHIHEETFHRKIEISPLNGWDLFQLIEFISYIPEGFHSDEVQKTNIEKFDKKLSVYFGNQGIFDIYVTNGLERQKVLIKSPTNWLEWCDRKQIFLVNIVQFTLNKPQDHPLIVFGKHFTHGKRSPKPILRNMFMGLFKRPKNDSKINSIKYFLKRLPGHVEIVEQNKTGNGYPTSEGKELQRLTWICAWAAGRIENTHYIELDASFKASKPYCYCCVNSIRNNESIVIALTIGISESSELYESTYLSMEKAGINSTILNSIPVLSDMGLGLFYFCLNRNLIQYICHKHILEVFGNKILRCWVKRLLECMSEDEYDHTSILISNEINIWVSQIPDPNQIPQKINDIRCMLDKFNTSRFYSIEKWALWVRAKHCVGRCSNHSEAIHRVFNSHCHWNQNFLTRIDIITHDIIVHLTRQESNHGRSLKEKYSKLLALSMTSKKVDTVENCNCGWNMYYSKIFGVRFPCIHEVKNFKCPSPPELILTTYKYSNIVNYLFSDVTININGKNDDNNISNINEIDLNSEQEKHLIKYSNGPKSMYAKKQMWKVVSEMRSMYGISREDSFDIVVDKYSQFNLNDEECATEENISLFRIACWKEGEKFQSQSKSNKKR